MKKPKVIIYDNDGMITKSERFSDRYKREFGVDQSVIDEFFNQKFRECLHGRTDLKEELIPFLEKWKWQGSVDELLDYWFETTCKVYQNVYDSIKKLRDQGAIVCLATNQEKYRTEFLINKFKYDEVFNEVFSSSDLGCFKTVPEGLNKIHKLLNEKYGDVEKGEIMFWDDREGNVGHVLAEGFNGQQFTDYEYFKKVIEDSGYKL